MKRGIATPPGWDASQSQVTSSILSGFPGSFSEGTGIINSVFHSSNSRVHGKEPQYSKPSL